MTTINTTQNYILLGLATVVAVIVIHEVAVKPEKRWFAKLDKDKR